MVYLTKTTEEYFSDTREEADGLVEEAKNDPKFMLGSNKTTYKTIKAKGEVVAEYYLTQITKVFTDSKEPTDQFEVEYRRVGAF